MFINITLIYILIHLTPSTPQKKTKQHTTKHYGYFLTLTNNHCKYQKHQEQTILPLHSRQSKFRVLGFFLWCIRKKILHRSLWYLQNITTFYTISSFTANADLNLQDLILQKAKQLFSCMHYMQHLFFPLCKTLNLHSPHTPPTLKQKGITALICYSSIEFISGTVTSDLQLGIWYPKFKARSWFLTVFSVLHRVSVLTSR